jgi:hypothetical protein
MKRSPFSLILFIVAVLISAFCLWGVINLFGKGSNSDACPLVPGWFSKKDLTGTWIAKDYMLNVTDMITFRDDGKYKQVVLGLPSGSYESDWQDWRIEYGEKGIPYLYLHDLRLCAVSPYVSCDEADHQTTGPWDCCNGNPPKPLPGEEVLAILGPPTYSTPAMSIYDMSITLFRGCENSAWSYRYQAP